MAHRVAGRLNWRTFGSLFWVLAAVYALHLAWRWLAWSRPWWVRHYLDDLLCLPLVLTFTLFVLRFFYDPQRRLNRYHVAFAVLYVTLVFEVLLPRYMPRYTADWLDVLLYATGGLIFYRFMNR